MESNEQTNINYMKYITLFLLLSVLFYGFTQKDSRNQAVATASYYVNELPIYCVDTEKPVLALTFDSAWGDEDLEEILAILKKHNVPATFFVTGEWVDKYPEAIKLIDKHGHEVANHGNSHKHMPQISKKEMIQEIQACHDKVYALIEKDMTSFRAPYSDWDENVVAVTQSLGYSAINHSVDSLDWKDYGVESIIQTVCEHKNLENGSILLLHNGATYTKDALDVMLTNLKEQGFSFVTVSDLVYSDNYSLDHTGKQFLNKKE